MERITPRTGSKLDGSWPLSGMGAERLFSEIVARRVLRCCILELYNNEQGETDTAMVMVPDYSSLYSINTCGLKVIQDCYSKTPVNTLSCVSPSAPSIPWKRLKQSIKPLETFLFSGVAVKCSNRVATALLTSFFSRMAIFAWKIVAS
jgi:hypothetical protein